MKRLMPFLYFILTSFAAVRPAFVAPPQVMAQSQPTLYQRLGGCDAIAAVTDDFLTHLASDPQLGRFFTGLSSDSKIKVRQHVVDFLCVATGGPCKYTGRDVRTAHTGLNISEVDWNTSVNLVGTLDKFKVPEKAKSEVPNAIGGLKGDIVGR